MALDVDKGGDANVVMDDSQESETTENALEFDEERDYDDCAEC